MDSITHMTALRISLSKIQEHCNTISALAHNLETAEDKDLTPELVKDLARRIHAEAQEIAR